MIIFQNFICTKWDNIVFCQFGGEIFLEAIPPGWCGGAAAWRLLDVRWLPCTSPDTSVALSPSVPSSSFSSSFSFSSSSSSSYFFFFLAASTCDEGTLPWMSLRLMSFCLWPLKWFISILPTDFFCNLASIIIYHNFTKTHFSVCGRLNNISSPFINRLVLPLACKIINSLI